MSRESLQGALVSGVCLDGQHHRVKLAGREPPEVKTYVGNRVSEIVDHIPPDRWNHVVSADNPADCASRGILPSQLHVLGHELWWTGPPWLQLEPSQWPKWEGTSEELPVDEERALCLASVSLSGEPVVPFEQYSTFTRLQRVVALIFRFINKCRPSTRAVSATGKLLSLHA